MIRIMNFNCCGGGCCGGCCFSCCCCFGCCGCCCCFGCCGCCDYCDYCDCCNYCDYCGCCLYMITLYIYNGIFLLGKLSGKLKEDENTDIVKNGNLAKSKSFDLGSMSSKISDSEESSNMSFDSDGLPVPKSPKGKKVSHIPETSNNSITTKPGDNEGERLNILSPSYQKMRQESLMSPIEDDDDDLDNIMGESLGLSSRGNSNSRYN